MVRINLLPAEIIERRRWERWYPLVFLGAGVLLAIVVVAWLAMQLFVSQRSAQLQQTEQTVANLQREAGKLAIFEQQRAALEQRQQVVSSALQGRIDMGRLLEEISLVLPDKVWFTEMVLNEESGGVFLGATSDIEEPQISEGYKAVAATLVRLNSLDALRDVWLTVAESDQYQDFQGEATGASAKVVSFEMTAKISAPSVPTTQTAVPAPPTQAGQ